MHIRKHTQQDIMNAHANKALSTRPDMRGTNPARLTSKPAPIKLRPWSHQRDLSELRGKTASVILLDGSVVSGVVSDADNFTVAITTGAFAAHANDERHKVVLFKHAMAAFWAN